MASSYSTGNWNEEKDVDPEMQKHLDSMRPEFEKKHGKPTAMFKGISYRQSKDTPRLFLMKVQTDVQLFASILMTISGIIAKGKLINIL